MSETKSIKTDLEKTDKKFDVGSWLIPIIAVFIALFIGGILIKLQGVNDVNFNKIVMMRFLIKLYY